MKIKYDGKVLKVQHNYGPNLRNSLTETGAIKGEGHEPHDPTIYITLESPRGYEGLALKLADADAFARSILDHVDAVREACQNYEEV